MSKTDWVKMRRTLQKVHNVHVKRALKKISSASEIDSSAIKARLSPLYQQCLIDNDDTVQLALLKEIFFWIDLGHFSDVIQATASVPEWWQVRAEAKRPQLIIQFANRGRAGRPGKSRFSLSIPHYKGTSRTTKSPIPPYRKGQHEGILTLFDNSKVIVNAFSDAEAERVLKAAEKHIKPRYLKNSHIKIGIRKGVKLSTAEVIPVLGQYFPTGLQNLNPKWSSNFF